MINVYAPDASDFSNNGLATLEPTSCELSLTINGAWVLSLEHPFDENEKYKNLDNAEPISSELKKGNILKVTGITALRDSDSTQLFRIYDTVKSLTSIKVTAFPIGMEATYDAIIEELKLNNKNGKQVISELRTAASEVTAGSDTGKYTLSVDSNFPTAKKRSVNYKNTNLIAALCGSDDGSFVNTFNAEVTYNNYEIKVKKRLGSTTDYEVMLGKNLTGLSFEIDDSAVVTRIYPISQDDLRLKDSIDRRYPSGSVIRYIDSDNDAYPYIRAAFVEVPYSLIDTDTEALVPSATAVLTETVYNAIYDEIYRLMFEFWTNVVEDNDFSYGSISGLSLVPEYVQSVIRDISEAVANNVLGTSLDNVYVAHPGLRSWLTNAIRAGMDWIAEVDLPEKGWIENQDGSYSYGTDLRNLKNEWAYIDRKMSYFDNSEKWAKEKDDSFEWDWVQKKGQRRKFGNNKRYLARNTYVYDYDGGCKYYWFDEEGWWDGTSETSGWGWHQDSTGWWFGDADPDGDDSKYIHDDWAFIRATSDSARKLYYFDSDGYLDDSKTETVDWNWHQVNGRWYFGSSNHENRATYLTSQWMYIDGDWRLFDSNGYVEDLETTKAALISALTSYLQDECGTLINTEQNALFDLLYEKMEEYCTDLYENGLDKPTINVSVDFVDLSKTQEYAAFSNLEKVCLGDDVEVHDPVHGIDSISERVMGLTYDCIKGCNTQISVGGVSSVTSLFDTSVKGTGNEQRLVAGENVTISGNVINVSGNNGDVYAGDRVSVTQLQTSGNPIAKIYVNGSPTTIYAVGTDVQVNPIKQSGDKIATITVGGVAYDIYADTGLKYWVETETDIYRTGQRDGISGSAVYLKKSTLFLTTYGASVKCEERKANHNPALCAYVVNSAAQGAVYGTYYVSTKDEDAEWEWRSWVQPYGQEGYWGDWIAPGQQGQIYTLYDTSASFQYKGATWYVHMSNKLDTYETLNIPSIPYVVNESIVDTAKRIIDLANAEPYTEDIVGISNQDHILYYNDDKKNNYDTENRDDAVYISKEGVFNGTEFRVNGTAIGSFYKTNLYLGTGYSATVGLSDSYTDYDLLLIETYNQDDKKNLASMVNVSDLANASYIGVDGYLMYTITNGRTLTFHEAPSDTNHSRYIKAVYGLRTSHESGTQSPIEDVTVDGASVVSGGVAVIDLSGKQDALSAGDNVQISNQGVISATDTTYSDFAGSAHGLVPPVSTQAGKFLKDDGTWGTPASGASSISNLTDVDLTNLANGQILKYNSTSQKWENANESGGTTEIVTHTVQHDTSEWAIKHNYSYTYVQKSSSTATGKWWNFATRSDVANVDYHEEVVYKIPIPTTARKIRYRFETNTKNQNGSDNHIVIGLKTTLDITNYAYTSDTDYVFKADMFLMEDGDYEGEIEIQPSVPMYLYVTTEGWNLDIYQLDIVEYSSGGASTIDDLTDVDITTPSDGQVLQYDSTNSKWVNATPSGGGITRETIWTGAVKAVNDSGTLDKAISDYDYILVYGHPTDVPYEYHLDLLDVNCLLTGIANNSGYFSYEYYDTYYCRCKFSDETHFSCTQRQGGGSSFYEFTKMVGIKL